MPHNVLGILVSVMSSKGLTHYFPLSPDQRLWYKSKFVGLRKMLSGTLQIDTISHLNNSLNLMPKISF